MLTQFELDRAKRVAANRSRLDALGIPTLSRSLQEAAEAATPQPARAVPRRRSAPAEPARRSAREKVAVNYAETLRIPGLDRLGGGRVAKTLDENELIELLSKVRRAAASAGALRLACAAC